MCRKNYFLSLVEFVGLSLLFGFSSGALLAFGISVFNTFLPNFWGDPLTLLKTLWFWLMGLFAVIAFIAFIFGLYSEQKAKEELYAAQARNLDI
ncbi:hypothetical protein AAFX60_006980 [Aliivibrio fischeri]